MIQIDSGSSGGGSVHVNVNVVLWREIHGGSVTTRSNARRWVFLVVVVVVWVPVCVYYQGEVVLPNSDGIGKVVSYLRQS